MKTAAIPIFFTILGLSLASKCNLLALPSPTGKYNVGIRRHVIDFVNEPDPTSPQNISREYLATLYYPTRDEQSAPVPYLEPELAQGYADVWDFNISSLTSTVHWNATFLPEVLGPTLLFGPGGWGPPTDGYTVLLSELASRGYFVAALDHVFEQPFLRFPNGTGVSGLPLDYSPEDLTFLVELNAVRVKEMLHFIDYLPELATELNISVATYGIGAFGHSLGGSAALSCALESDAVAAAINLDGTMWDWFQSNPETDLGKPSLILGSEGHELSNDPSWENYRQQQTGWWRLFTVNGSSHLEFSDAAYWKIFGTTREVGPIDAKRMIDVTNAYVTAFFDEHLRGEKQPILDGNSAEWPEVTYIAG
ncbi:platelet-activating factor acetylhydrolase [Paramyrothecium foliicola]|nr:platelet-activating factor acetylhydrolase [Paramyrothecium foliicola]